MSVVVVVVERGNEFKVPSAYGPDIVGRGDVERS